MPFQSKHAPKIWDWLYTVSIPDNLTQDPEYIKKFGVRVTGNKLYDHALENSFITVRISIAKILEYFTNGIEVRIPARADLIAIHKNIELYLEEWREYVRASVHGQHDIQSHKVLILNLEKLSKYIFDRATPSEVLQRLIEKKNFGLVNPINQLKEKEEFIKPDYKGIKQLINKPKSKSSLFRDEDVGQRFK